MSIKLKLTFIFLIISVVPIIFVSVLGFTNAKDAIIKATLQNINTIAESKEAAILSYLKAKRERALAYASDGFIRSEVERILNIKDRDSRIQESSVLNRYLMIDKLLLDKDIIEIKILDTDGSVIAASHNEDLGQKDHRAHMQKGRTGSHIHDFGMNHNRPIIAVGTSIVDIGNKNLMGTLLLDYSIESVRHILSGESALQAGAETALELSGTTGVYITNINKGLLMSVNKMEDIGFMEESVETEAVLRCIESGAEVLKESVDYRGRPVFTASMCPNIDEGIRWALVVEQDVEEALTPVNNLKTMSIVTGTIVLFFVILSAFFIANSISTPIRKLTAAVKNISSGRFDVEIPVENTNDEIGTLSRAFSQMIDSLRSAKSKVEQKTGELAKNLADMHAQNKELEETKKAMLNLVEDLETARSETEKWSKELEIRVEKRTGELKKSQAQLMQSEKMGAVGTMAAGVAHELNNPMMGILNFIQYCIKHTSEDDRRYPVLQDTKRETERCVDIVKNLLTFSRMEKEGVEARQKESCAVIFERVFKLLSYRIEKERVSVTQNYAEGTPETWMKVNNIQQVFFNLVGNALDALKDSDKKEIHVDIDSDEKYVRVTVADTGDGIPTENLQTIFEPFFTTKTVGEGTGLGLSVCHSIVKAHEGEITCESGPGEGTKFKVLLPIDIRNENRT